MDITKLSEKELMEINHKVVERLRFLRHARAHEAMLDFNVGQAVSFETDRGKIEGIISKFNKKTVTIVTEEGGRWNVAPSFLSAITPVRDVTPPKNVIAIEALSNSRDSGSSKGASRNAPCPCGSGKKYKRCCLRKESLH